jgi:hypothetical protein
MPDKESRALLADLRRDIEDAVQEISQAVEKLEGGEGVGAEALLAEAMTRLRLLNQRIDEQLADPG